MIVNFYPKVALYPILLQVLSSNLRRDQCKVHLLVEVSAAYKTLQVTCSLNSAYRNCPFTVFGFLLTPYLSIPELHRRSARATHLAQTNTELSSLLHSRHQSDDDQSTMKKNRKLERMTALREVMKETTNGGGDENRAVQSLLVSHLY